MTITQESALRTHRRRLRERGLKRVELQAGESDASLLRELARILRSDSERAERARKQLRELITEQPAGLKALLCAAPLDGIRITRSADRGRTVEL